MKKIWLIFAIFFSYQFFFGTYLFIFDVEKNTDVSFDISVLEDSFEGAKAKIIDDNNEALYTRLALIHQSQESIKIAVHTFASDDIGELMTAALLQKLDEGVKVDIIIDGVMNRNTNQGIYSLLINQGANLYIYEPNTLLFPGRTQNRLHDKFFIFDDEIALMSGRNIGERYFTIDNNAVHDRDIIFIEQNSITEMSAYFNQLITSDFTKKQTQTRINQTLDEAVREYYTNETQQYNFTDISQNILNTMIDVDSIMFIHNPINRWKKKPVLLNTLLSLVEQEQKAFIQTPYIIFDPMMKKQFNDVSDLDITFLTNTIETSPNIFASSGYHQDRAYIANTFSLYEIQSSIYRHTKTWLIGDEYLSLGSFNIDPRSSSLSTESMVIIKSTTLFNQLHVKLSQEVNISLQLDENLQYINNDNLNEVPDKPLKLSIIRTIGLFMYFFQSLL